MTTRAEHGHWLSLKRVTVYPRICFVVFLLTAVVWIMASHNMVDRQGKPLGADFIQFWSASKLALTGHAADSYNFARLFAQEQIAIPASKNVIPWSYPPSLFLVVLPLGLLPYVAAWAVWEAVGVTTFLLVFHKMFADVKVRRVALWCVLGFPGFWVTLNGGQNGFLTGALAGGAMLALPKRPVLAGCLIGLLTFKPHLAVLFPLALVLVGAWRALAAAVVTGEAFLAAGTWVAGVASLKAFFANAGTARMFLESGAAPLEKMPTVFVLVKLLGGPNAVSYAVHGVVALVAIAALVWVWRGSKDWGLRGASLLTATFLVSPYSFDYDLVWLAFPIAWLALIGLRDGWLAGEREVLVAAWVLPVVLAPWTKMLGFQFGPLVLGALLWVCVRRVRVAASHPSTAG
jgi:hypothetical protein